MANDAWNNRIGREVRRGIRNRLVIYGPVAVLGLIAMAPAWDGGIGAWASLGGIALIVGAWNVACGVVHGCDPTRHPSVRRLSRYGDPVKLANDIETHLRAPGDRVEIGDAVITRLWFLKPTFFGIDAVPVRAIVWAYVTAETYYVHHVFAGAHLCHAFFHTTEGDVLRIYGTDAIEGSNLTVEEAVKFVAATVPSAVFGYSDELKRMWRRDRHAFLQLAARRSARV